MRIDRLSKILVLTGLCIFLSGGLFSAMAQDVIRASGGTDISVDEVTTGEFTLISGPAIRETESGQLAENGTLILTLPNGYEWNSNLTAEDIAVEVTPVGTNNTDLVVEFTSITESEFTITVTTESRTSGRGRGPGRVEISGLELRPTNGNVPDEGTIFNTGSTGPDANYGNLSKVAGALSEVLVETSSDGSGGVVSTQNLRAADDLTVYSIARDSFGNFIENIALDDESDWSLIDRTGNIPLSALSPVASLQSATFNSQRTGTTKIRASVADVDLTPSETITVTPRAASEMIISTQPSSTATAGEAFPTQPELRLLDQFGNLVTTDNETEITAQINTGDGTLFGTLTQTASEGVVSLTDLMMEKANTITLKFTSPNLSSVNSNEIVIEPNTETDLVYIEQPTNTANNSTIDPPVEVRLLDDFGNFVNKSGEDITIVAKDDQNIEPNEFFKNNATTVVTTNNDGIAVFDDLDLHNNTDEGEYTLEASFDGINNPVASNTFIVLSSGDFAKFAITNTDGNPIGEQEAGVPFMIRVSALDGDDNVYDNFENDFEGTIELTSDSDIEGTIQTTFTEQDFTNGILETTFTLTSTGETRVYGDFEGTDGENNSITRDGRSNIFNVVPTDVDFVNTVASASPAQITANGESTSQVTVQLRDEFENNLTGGGETITIETNAGTLSNGTESGVTSLTAIDQGDGTYTATLTSSTNIETATVEAFEDSDMENPIGAVAVEFTAGGLDNFIITIPTDNGDPATQTAGVEFLISVEAVDENGNLVESYSGELTFSSNSVISEGGTAEISNGVLEDHPITLTQSGNSVTISVTDEDIFGVQGLSEEFVVVPAGPNTENSNVLANPTVIQNDGTSTSTITIVLRDEFGNRIQENLINDIIISLEQIEEEGNPSSGDPEATLDDLSHNAGANNYQATLTASTTIEIIEIAASFNGEEINQTATISIVLPNTWDPGGGPAVSRRDWTNGDNWSLGTQPTADDFVIIPGDVDPYPDLDINTTIGSLEVQGGALLVLFEDRDFEVRGGIQIDGTFDIENNTELTMGGNFTGTGTFTAGNNSLIETGGNLNIDNFFAGIDGTTVQFTGESQQNLNSETFLVHNIEVYNDVIAGSGDVIEAFEIFIDEGTTFELQQDAGITLENIENIFGNGSLILSNNTLVLRGDFALLNIDASEGTVIFGILQNEEFADYPDLQQQQIQNLTQMRSAIINNTEGVRTFDDIIIDDEGTLTLENGELIISSGKNFIANNITYNNGFLTFRRSLSQSGWRLLSSPITNTFQDWFNGLTLQGMENSNFPDRQPNLLFYDETFEGTDNQRWRTPGNAADELIPGRGYFFFVFGNVEEDDDYNDSLPQTLTVTGEEHTPAATESHLDLNVTYTAEADTGFNLVGNPYGATINWDDESWVKENMDDVIYVWDESTNQYRSWNGVSGSLESGNIAPFQGFWVKANNEDEEINPSLQVSPDAKTTGGIFLKSQRSSAQHEWPVLKMQVEGAGMQHSTHFTFTEGGRNNIDYRDAYRLLPFDTNTYLEIFTLLNDGTELAINNLPRKFGKPIELPLHVSGVNNGAIIDNTITLTWPELTNIPDEWKIILHDSHSNESVNLRDHSFYDFELNAHAKTPPEMNTSTNFRLVEKSMAKKQSARFTIEIDPGADADGVPDDVVLHQNYPNPFNQATTIQFGVPIEQRVKIEVFDVLGRRVQTITDQRYQPGYHEVPFNGRSLASGVYFYRLVTDEKILDKQMTLIK